MNNAGSFTVYEGSDCFNDAGSSTFHAINIDKQFLQTSVYSC